MLSKEKLEKVNELVKSLKNENIEPLDELYNLMFEVLFRFLKNFNANEQTILDTIKETFIIVYQKAQSKIVYKNCYSWILSIAKNCLFNNKRKDLKFQCIEEVNLSDFESQGGNLEDTVAIKLIIEKLPPLEQDLIYFKVCEGLTLDEIAKIYKLSKRTIIRRYNSVREYLKEELKDEW